MTAQLTETGTRLCRQCKNELPPQKTGRPRSYCLDCRPRHADRKNAVVDELRRYQGYLPNGRAAIVVVTPTSVRVALKRNDGSGAWGAPMELNNVKGSTWVGDMTGTDGLTVMVRVHANHVILTLTPPSAELRFDRVTS